MAAAYAKLEALRKLELLQGGGAYRLLCPRLGEWRGGRFVCLPMLWSFSN